MRLMGRPPNFLFKIQTQEFSILNPQKKKKKKQKTKSPFYGLVVFVTDAIRPLVINDNACAWTDMGFLYSTFLLVSNFFFVFKSFVNENFILVVVTCDWFISEFN